MKRIALLTTALVAMLSAEVPLGERIERSGIAVTVVNINHRALAPFLPGPMKDALNVFLSTDREGVTAYRYEIKIDTGTGITVKRGTVRRTQAVGPQRWDAMLIVPHDGLVSVQQVKITAIVELQDVVF